VAATRLGCEPHGEADEPNAVAPESRREVLAVPGDTAILCSAPDVAPGEVRQLESAVIGKRIGGGASGMWVIHAQ
jgi:hypothetical protein